MKKIVILLLIIFFNIYSKSLAQKSTSQIDDSLKLTFIDKIINNPDNILDILREYDFTKQYLEKLEKMEEDSRDQLINNLINTIKSRYKGIYKICHNKRFEVYWRDEIKLSYNHEISVVGKLDDELLTFHWELLEHYWILKDIYFENRNCINDK